MRNRGREERKVLKRFKGEERSYDAYNHIVVDGGLGSRED